MSRYFFHLHDEGQTLRDTEGRSIDGREAIARAALRQARAMISADALDGTIRLCSWIEVEDEACAVVHRLNFRDAIEIR